VYSRAFGEGLGGMRKDSVLSRAVTVSLAIAFAVTASEQEAFAYTDPGSGALIWQLVVSAVIGGTFWIRKLLGAIRKKAFREENPKVEKSE
jgi:hypothetical protein